MGIDERNNPFLGHIERHTEQMGHHYIRSNENCPQILPKEGPTIIPCYNGRSIKIHEDLVVNGLSAISIKHHKGNCKDDRRSSEGCTNSKRNHEKEKDARKMWHYREIARTATDVPECLKDKMKRRNSFWNVHRPELSKLTWPENFVSSTVLQDFFHNHLRIHGTFCEPLHEFSTRSLQIDEEFRNYSKLREIVPPRILPPDERVISIMEKSRSVQLNDEDLDPETMVHKSRAEFCVTIGEYVRRPPLKRTTSQIIPKCLIQPASRYESLPIQHEGLLSKETMTSEEKIFSVIGSAGIVLNSSGADTQRLVATSPPSVNNLNQQKNDEGTEDGGDPSGLKTILSPRDETAEETGSVRFKV